MIQNSEQLKSLIQNLIVEQGGQIRFADYMQLALYTPGLGYYSAGNQKFGRNGDFVTAPELGSLFAKCLAKQCREFFDNLNCKNILEIGAGSGQLAHDLIFELGDDLDQYYILDLSAELRARQLAKNPSVKFLNSLPKDFCGVIIANEVLDAMPVSRFYYANNVLQEYYVTEDLKYTYGPASAKLASYFNNAKIQDYISETYSSEANLWLPNWIKSLSDCLQQGAILLFDYGFPRKEYYHPQRNTGTLMCHHQHRCHDDPFHLPGLQDITAHVDFTAIAEAADSCELAVAGFTHLAGFLLNCDITSFIKDHYKQAAEINTLTSPAEMGELFKVICLMKNLDKDLRGFANYDRTHTL